MDDGTASVQGGAQATTRALPPRLRGSQARLAEVGFICEGSLAVLYTSCGNPNCRCQNPD